jgi:hypothetical protein
VADDALIHELARAAILAGMVPVRKPVGTWGGSGTGGKCVICGEPITAAHMEMEVAFEQQSEYRFHIGCFRAWEFERTKMSHGTKN